MCKVELANVLYEKEGDIAIVTVNRPKALNALNAETLADIEKAMDAAAADPEVKVVILTGAGRAFVAGADITFMQNMTAMEGRAFAMLGQAVFRKIETMEKPVIAAVNGFALGGGCELAMSCDFRIASDAAKFGQPEVGLGVTPGFGGTQRLPRLVGVGMAKELCYTGDTIDANEALRIGLVNHVVPGDELMTYVKDMAKRIASKGQLAVRMCKKAINEGMQMDIDRSMTLEADIFGILFSTEEQKEGMTAFVEKRKPVFTGK
jgi:enoyl-CoA hydratase